MSQPKQLIVAFDVQHSTYNLLNVDNKFEVEHYFHCARECESWLEQNAVMINPLLWVAN